MTAGSRLSFRKIWLAPLAGAAAFAMLATEAGACSMPPVRPANWGDHEILTHELERLRTPRLAPLIRDAAFIEIAIAGEQVEIGRSNRYGGNPEMADREAAYLSVQFDVVDRLKGQGANVFTAASAGGYPIVAAYVWDGVSPAGERNDIIDLDEWTDLVPTVEVDSCGGVAGAGFVTGRPYLLIRGRDGDIQAAIELASRPVTREDIATPGFQDSLWLRVVRRALENPLRDRVHEATTREYLRAWRPATLLEVRDCARPYLAEIGRFPVPASGYRPYDMEGYPTSLEEFLASDFARQFEHSHLHPPLGYADYVVIDRRRYEESPVDPRFCELGQRFLHVGWYQYFPVDEYDLVDLTNIATQVYITDLGRYPLSQVAEWLQPEPPQ